MSLRRRIYATPVPKMPPGIVELMDGLARDVLKNNPENIYEFCAHHMQKLLEMRDGNAPKPLVTLDQKIAKAQKAVRQRAERRRNEFDKKFISASNNCNNLDGVAISKSTCDISPYSDVPEKEDKKTVELNEIEQIEVKAPLQTNSDFLNTDIRNDNGDGVVDTVGKEKMKECKENTSNTNQGTFSLNLIEKKHEANNVEECDNTDKDLIQVLSEEQHVTQDNPSVTDSDKICPDINNIDNTQEKETKSNTATSTKGELLASNTTTTTTTTTTQGEHLTPNTNTAQGEPLTSNINITPGVHFASVTNTTQGEHLASNTNTLQGEPLAFNSNTTLVEHLASNTNTTQVEHLESNTNTALGEHLASNTNTTEAEEIASNTQLELNDKTEEKMTIKQNSEIQLQKEGIENIIQSYSDSQKQTDETVVKNTGGEVSSTNNVTERAVTSLGDTPSNNYHSTNTEESKGQNDTSLSNSLNKDSNKNEIDTGTIENHINEFNETKKQQDDGKILAVILNEPGYVQSNKLEPVENDGTDPNLKETSDADAENVEIKDEKIMNSSMDLETAAITIQKVFRSFLFKTKTASYDDSTTVDINLLTEDKEKDESDTSNIKDRRPLGISRMDTVLQTVNEEKSLSLSTDDSSTFSSAATIIQAHVRGFLVRNKFNSNKTTSSNSLIDSDAPSVPSLEADNDNRKCKTVLNIHIVPEGGHFVSRDESILTSMDLSLDGSPPSSVNLHPLGYDKSERRKLKREDAIQSVSPPSNNSGKLSDDLDSVKELSVADTNIMSDLINSEGKNIPDSTPNIVFSEDKVVMDNVDSNHDEEIADVGSDEMDVITPFTPVDGRSSRESVNSSKLLHSGEFHDVVLPTNVTRCDPSVVREFQNVLVYFILWNN